MLFKPNIALVLSVLNKFHKILHQRILQWNDILLNMKFCSRFPIFIIHFQICTQYFKQYAWKLTQKLLFFCKLCFWKCLRIYYRQVYDMEHPHTTFINKLLENMEKLNCAKMILMIFFELQAVDFRLSQNCFKRSISHSPWQVW